MMSRKRTYTLRQIKDKILASDSDSEFECSDISDGTDDSDDDWFQNYITSEV